MKTISKIVVVLLMVLGLNSLANAEVKNFFINGVNNSLEKTRDSRDSITGSISEIEMVEVLHNTDNGFLTDFWEAGKMMIYLDNFFTENGNISTSYNLWLEYKNHSNRDESTDKLIVRLATVYMDIKKRGGNLDQYIDNIKLVRNSGLNSTVTDYLQKLGLEYYNHPTFKKVRIEDYTAAIGEVMSHNPDIFTQGNQEFSDLEAMVTQLNIQDSDKFNFIAHSQGNSYMNRLARYIVDIKGVPVENIRTLSIATPEHYVYPYSEEESWNKYITLEEDWMSLAFTGLSQNSSNGSILDGILGGYVFFNISNGDITGHGFRETYMKEGSNSREWIRKRYLENYNELKALDENETVISLNHKTWINSLPEASNENPTAGNTISVDVTVGYSSNQARSQTVKTCFRITNSESWSDVVRDIENTEDYVFSYDPEIDGDSKTETYEINYFIPRNFEGEYYLAAKVDCDGEIPGEEKQIQFRRINVEKLNKICVPDEIEKSSCSVRNGVGEKSRTCSSDGYSQSSFGSCELKSCDSGYEIENDSCVKKQDSGDIYLKNVRADKDRVKAGYERIEVDYHVYSTAPQQYIYTSFYISKNSTFNRSEAEYLDRDRTYVGGSDTYDSRDESFYIPHKYSGYQYIHVVGNDLNGEISVTEKDRTNNIVSFRIYVEKDPAYEKNENDVYLHSVSIDDISPAPGQRVEVDYNLRYRGDLEDTDVGNTDIMFLFSRYSKLEDAIDLSILDKEDENVGLGDDVRASYESFDIPEDVGYGTYYLHIVAVMTDTADSNLNNNLKTIKITIPEIDIYLSRTYIDYSTVELGKEYDIRTRVNFSGNIREDDMHENVDTSIFISKNSKFVCEESIFLDDMHSNLGSDERREDEKRGVDIPEDYPLGTAYIHVVAGIENDCERTFLNEKNIKNNTTTLRVSVIGNRDDFYLTNSRVSDSTVYRGQRIKAYTYVNYSGNTKDRDMRSVYTSYYIACGNGLEYSSYDTSSLGSDDRRHRERGYITIPKDCETGEALVIISTDDKNGYYKFEETDESNNWDIINISIR